MRIAIIGASGFIGGHLAGVLAGDGHDILGIGRGDALPPDHFDLVVDCNGDARRFWACENPALSFAATVASTAERLFALKAERYLYLSTVDVYGAARAARATSMESAPIDPAALDGYGFHKYLAEQLVAFHAKRPLLLRLGTVIGPGLKKNPIHDALHGLPIRQTLDSTLTLIDLETIGRAVQSLLQADATGIFNLTGSASISVAAMIASIACHQNRPTADYRQHGELLHTDYDVNVDSLGRLLDLPTSQSILDHYLESLQS